LFGNFAMPIEESVKIRRIPVVGIVSAGGITILYAIRCITTVGVAILLAIGYISPISIIPAGCITILSAIRNVTAVSIAIRLAIGYISPVGIIPAGGVAVLYTIRCIPAIGIANLFAICYTSPIGIVPAAGIAILSTGVTIAHARIVVVETLKPHERIRALADLLLNTRVFLQIRIQVRMALQELRVVDQ
jgi:hypothetical protein